MPSELYRSLPQTDPEIVGIFDPKQALEPDSVPLIYWKNGFNYGQWHVAVYDLIDGVLDDALLWHFDIEEATTMSQVWEPAKITIGCANNPTEYVVGELLVPERTMGGILDEEDPESAFELLDKLVKDGIYEGNLEINTLKPGEVALLGEWAIHRSPSGSTHRRIINGWL